MGGRVGSLTVFLVVLAAGALLGSALVQWWDGRGPDGPPAAESADRDRIRVEVLNAGGRANMARIATDLLRSQGFDVVYFGNADRFGRDSSAVLDRTRRLEAARAVGDALGIRSVLSQPDSNLYVDATVLLGEDWDPPPQGDEPAEPAAWNPRRWLR